MDEQRILEEMERMLAADDPKLAARLAAFGQPGLGQVLRTRRARATLSIMVLVLIAAVAAVIYLMSAFRPGNPGTGHQPRSVHQHSAAPASRAGTNGVASAPALPVSRPTGPQIKHPTTGQCAATVAPACGSWTTPSAQAQPQPSR
jgi:Protein of unknown function (DUF3040)